MATKPKLIEQKVQEILEQEAKKHVTHVGFAIVAVYKGGPTVIKTAYRKGCGQALSDAIFTLSCKQEIFEG